MAFKKLHRISDIAGSIISGTIGTFGLSKIFNSYLDIYTVEKSYEFSQDIITKYTIISGSELAEGLVYTGAGLMGVASTYFISKGLRLMEGSNEKGTSG